MKNFAISFFLLFLSGAHAKSVILFIADGAGSSAIAIARHEKRIATGEELYLDTLPQTALIKTSSSDNIVTDSAAAATAMATGAKTNKGYVGIDPSEKKLQTVLEIAKSMGKSVGVVTTTSVTDATPSAFYAHTLSRHNKVEIGKQLLQAEIDLVMGGGSSDFINMRYRIPNKYKFFDKFDKVTGINIDKPIFALFSKKHMDWVDGRQAPTLAQMTDFAVRHLSKNPNGFFLIIEGGLIDYAAHQNLAKELIAELLDYDDAVKTAVEIVKAKPLLRNNTLVIAVSDHETAGLSLNGYAHITQAPLKTDLRFTGVDYDMVTFTTGPKSKYPTKIATHTGTDVPAYAFGFMSEKIRGTKENNELFEIMLEALK